MNTQVYTCHRAVVMVYLFCVVRYVVDGYRWSSNTKFVIKDEWP